MPDWYTAIKNVLDVAEVEDVDLPDFAITYHKFVGNEDLIEAKKVCVGAKDRANFTVGPLALPASYCCKEPD